jgi:hypothetical protein
MIKLKQLKASYLFRSHLFLIGPNQHFLAMIITILLQKPHHQSEEHVLAWSATPFKFHLKIKKDEDGQDHWMTRRTMDIDSIC